MRSSRSPLTVRLATPQDEPAFVRLLRAAYGDTYSHRELYEPGGLGRWLASGRVTAFVDEADDGEIHSHTALLHKDESGDFLESGMSLRNLRLTAAGRTPDAEAWRVVLGRAREAARWLHQHTSTAHVFAQRHAARHLGARPTGFVLDYTVGEQLAQVRHPDGPMHALCMSSRLRFDDVLPTARLPDGPWRDWLALRFAHVELGVETVVSPPVPLTVCELERISSLGLVRRVVAAGGAPLAPEGRVDLVHVPTDARVGALPGLVAAGWVPVAVRPRTLAPPEVVCQRLTGDPRRLMAASLAGAEARAAREHWLATVTSR